MIQKYRNRGLIGIPLGLLLFGVATFVIIGNRNKEFAHQMPNYQILILLASIIGGHIAYLWGCFSLAKAKGHDSGVVMGGLIMAAILMPIVSLAVALGVVIGLEDKARGYSRTRRI